MFGGMLRARLFRIIALAHHALQCLKGAWPLPQYRVNLRLLLTTKAMVSHSNLPSCKPPNRAETLGKSGEEFRPHGLRAHPDICMHACLLPRTEVPVFEPPRLEVLDGPAPCSEGCPGRHWRRWDPGEA